MTKQEQLDQILQLLHNASASIEGSAIVTPDGMIIANLFHILRTDADSTAAMGAAMTGLGMRVAKVLKIGSMNEITIQGDQSSVLVFAIESRALLMVMISSKANLGLILMEARRIVEQLTKLL